jgi:hypothetical protein
MPPVSSIRRGCSININISTSASASGQPAVKLLVLVQSLIRSGLESNRSPSNQIPHCRSSEIWLADMETACCFAQGLGLLVAELDRNSYRRSPPGALMPSRFAHLFGNVRLPNG